MRCWEQTASFNIHLGCVLNNNKNISGPIVIGGSGGSGTRIVAEILKHLGFYLGSDLNSANDNLWFTLLFKRPRWFIKNSHEKDSQIIKGLGIFEKAMAGCFHPRYKEFVFLLHAGFTMALFGHDHSGSGRGLWPIKRIITMVKSKQPDPSGYIGWGWKEPNAHIYIPYLSKHFDNLKYLHIIRHGLDMAYSGNQAQLYNWGELFGVETPETSSLLPKASLQYWIKSNERAIVLGKKLLNERFLVINFDKLCLNPGQQIGMLITFLGLDEKSINMDQLVSLPKIPDSAGRYREHDLSVFDSDEIDSVRRLGFDVTSQ